MNPQHDTDRSASIGEQVSALCDGHLDPSGVDTLLAHCRESDLVNFKRPRDYVFVLAVRPFQVNPPSQFLNTVGGGIDAVIEVFDGGALGLEGVGDENGRRGNAH